jgi:hypothetical protein
MAPAPGALLELKFRGERQSDGRLPTHSRDSPGVRQPLITIAVKMTLRMERPLWMSSNDRLSDRLGRGAEWLNLTEVGRKRNGRLGVSDRNKRTS